MRQEWLQSGACKPCCGRATVAAGALGTLLVLHCMVWVSCVLRCRSSFRGSVEEPADGNRERLRSIGMVEFLLILARHRKRGVEMENY